jgi:hypothetical protein
MSTVLESITKKIEELSTTSYLWRDEEHIGHNGELLSRNYEEIVNRPGKITEFQLGNETNDYSVVELSDPRDYKEFFRLDDLGIAKSLKSCVIEVKDSECKIYYLLDSSLISISLSCKYQPLEVTKELPIATIALLRILSAKKAPIELNIYEDKIHIIFEDTIPKTTKDIVDSVLEAIEDIEKPKKRQKKEKPVAKKYTLEIPLSDLKELDKAVLHFIDNLDLDRYWNYKSVEPFELPISVKDIDSQCNVYTITSTTYGDFKSANINCNPNLYIEVIQCPVLVGKNFSKEEFIVKENTSEEIESDDEFLLVEEEHE